MFRGERKDEEREDGRLKEIVWLEDEMPRDCEGLAASDVGKIGGAPPERAAGNNRVCIAIKSLRLREKLSMKKKLEVATKHKVFSLRSSIS